MKEPRLRLRSHDLIPIPYKLLKPIIKEVKAWEGYDDAERLVELFPHYEGDLTVGDLRTICKAIDRVRDHKVKVALPDKFTGRTKSFSLR